MDAPPQQQQQTRLLAMDPVTLLEDGPKETWEAISDLDNFFARVYTYYNERGLRCILASRIISLLTLAFTIVLFIFLVEVLDWYAHYHDRALCIRPAATGRIATSWTARRRR